MHDDDAGHQMWPNNQGSQSQSLTHTAILEPSGDLSMLKTNGYETETTSFNSTDQWSEVIKISIVGVLGVLA